jgi:phosphate butyryltransferase
MNFEDIIKKAQQGSPKRFAVAAAEDLDVLQAVNEAASLGLAQPILVGDAAKIESLIKGNSLKSLENAEIVSSLTFPHLRK